MVVIHTSFLCGEDKRQWVPNFWQLSTHGDHHIASLFRKTEVDAGQLWCNVPSTSFFWLITLLLSRNLPCTNSSCKHPNEDTLVCQHNWLPNSDFWQWKSAIALIHQADIKPLVSMLSFNNFNQSHTKSLQFMANDLYFSVWNMH